MPPVDPQPEQRNHARRNVAGIRLLTIDLHLPDGTITPGRLLDASARGLAIACKGAAHEVLPPGTPVGLRLGIGDESIDLEATVRHAKELADGQRYGLQLAGAEGIGERSSSPLVRQLFDRRLSQRVSFEPEETVSACLRTLEQEALYGGTLRDLSAAGAAMQLTSADLAALEDVERVFLELILPGTRASLRLPCRIGERRDGDTGRLLALEFEGETDPALTFSYEAILDFVCRRVLAERPAA